MTTFQSKMPSIGIEQRSHLMMMQSLWLHVWMKHYPMILNGETTFQKNYKVWTSSFHRPNPSISLQCKGEWVGILAPRMVRVKRTYMNRIIVVCEIYSGPQNRCKWCYLRTSFLSLSSLIEILVLLYYKEIFCVAHRYSFERQHWELRTCMAFINYSFKTISEFSCQVGFLMKQKSSIDEVSVWSMFSFYLVLHYRITKKDVTYKIFIHVTYIGKVH